MNDCDFFNFSDIEIDFSSDVEQSPNITPQINNKKCSDGNKMISNKKKKRPPSKNFQKPKVLESLDLDKLMDGIEKEDTENDISKKQVDFKKEENIETKHIKKDKKIDFIPFDVGLSSKSTPIELFEHKIMNYFNSTIKDIIPLFLAELKFNLDESFDYEHQIHDFLSQIRYDIESVINEQSAIVNAKLNKVRNYFNFGFYFDNLSLPSHASNQLEINDTEKKHTLNGGILNNIDKITSNLKISKEKMIKNAFSKLKEMRSESDQIKNYLCQCSKSDEDIKKLSNIRCIFEKEQMILEFYEKQIQKVRTRQSKLRSHFQELYGYQQDSFHFKDNENDEDFIFIKSELNDLLKQIRITHKMNQKNIKITQFYNESNINFTFIKNDIHELFEKSKNIQMKQSLKQSKSFQTSTLLDYNYINNQNYLMNTSNIINQDESISSNFIVLDIRKRLENVQRISRENNYLLSNM